MILQKLSFANRAQETVKTHAGLIESLQGRKQVLDVRAQTPPLRSLTLELNGMLQFVNVLRIDSEVLCKELKLPVDLRAEIPASLPFSLPQLQVIDIDSPGDKTLEVLRNDLGILSHYRKFISDSYELIKQRLQTLRGPLDALSMNVYTAIETLSTPAPILPKLSGFTKYVVGNIVLVGGSLAAIAASYHNQALAIGSLILGATISLGLIARDFLNARKEHKDKLEAALQLATSSEPSIQACRKLVAEFNSTDDPGLRLTLEKMHELLGDYDLTLSRAFDGLNAKN
jgi:hypothetical protein